jgi:hypothetical protein
VADEPTPGEVARSLAVLRQEVHDDVREVREQLARTLNADVYAANCRVDAERERGLIARIDQVERELRVADNKREDADKQRAEMHAGRIADRKWLIAAIILPIGTALAELYVTFRGGR